VSCFLAFGMILILWDDNLVVKGWVKEYQCFQTNPSTAGTSSPPALANPCSSMLCC